ncbi:MAG: hypothetical protein WA210_13580 [Burkholderiaceae bacterium]
MNRHLLQLDFAQAAPRAPRLGLFLLVAGTVLMLICLTQFADALAAKASYREALAELDAPRSVEQAKSPPQETRDPRNASRSLATRQVSQSLLSPWAELLQALETAPRGSVALLSIEPSALKRTVRITAEARTAQDMLEHLKMLQSDPRLADVTLVTHERQVRVPGEPWRYQIQGAW